MVTWTIRRMITLQAQLIAIALESNNKEMYKN